MKRLFQINKPNGKIHADDKSDNRVFFDSKATAKIVRDELNREKPGTYKVSPGPDHRNYKG